MDGNLVDRPPDYASGPTLKPERAQAPCIVMFSGGRDSTIAALRLNAVEVPLRLVTISSGHLIGIERVRGRVRELQRILPSSTTWMQVKQPLDLRTDTSFYEMTCLPCHHSYVVVSGVIASIQGIHRLAFGYAHYQSDWPEQSPLAIERLTTVLARHGIKLELPAYDLDSREGALAALHEAGLSTDSLEQKCIQQVSNVRLPPERLKQQIDLWERSIDASMARLDEIKLDIVQEISIGDV
jgi:hypothetical protein